MFVSIVLWVVINVSESAVSILRAGVLNLEAGVFSETLMTQVTIVEVFTGV